MWERCSLPRLLRCLFRSQSGDICWDMQTHLARSCSPSHLPGRAAVSEVLETFLCFPRCSMQDPRAVVFLAELLQAPIFASKFLFPPSCPWHCFGLWRGRAEQVWCGAAVGSARMRCRGWCVLSSVNSTEECLHLANSVGFVSGEAAVQESGGGSCP